ncbi:uncharacterized protein V1518DRAFT_415647 [Limtongia smithiae]|uniref:uncharacterized protein n=1 Tax=Limtongia smithiae TaxID=1125753 RepID=UPI0034CFDAAC
MDVSSISDINPSSQYYTSYYAAAPIQQNVIPGSYPPTDKAIYSAPYLSPAQIHTSLYHPGSSIPLQVYPIVPQGYNSPQLLPLDMYNPGLRASAASGIPSSAIYHHRPQGSVYDGGHAQHFRPVPTMVKSNRGSDRRSDDRNGVQQSQQYQRPAQQSPNNRKYVPPPVAAAAAAAASSAVKTESNGTRIDSPTRNRGSQSSVLQSININNVNNAGAADGKGQRRDTSATTSTGDLMDLPSPTQTSTPVLPMVSYNPDDYAIPLAIAPQPGVAVFSLEESLKNPRNTTNVYIRGLAPLTNDHTLVTIVQRFGRLTTAKAMIDNVTGLCKGFGFAQFETEQEAAQCICGLAQYGYQTSFAKQSFALRLKELQNSESTNVYFSNIPRHWDKTEFKQILEEYSVVSLKVLRDGNGNNRGVGFARFATRQVAEEIVNKFHGLPIGENGTPIQVRFSDTEAQKRLKQITVKKRNWRAHEYQVLAAQRALEEYISMPRALMYKQAPLPYAPAPYGVVATAGQDGAMMSNASPMSEQQLSGSPSKQSYSAQDAGYVY